MNNNFSDILLGVSSKLNVKRKISEIYDVNENTFLE